MSSEERVLQEIRNEYVNKVVNFLLEVPPENRKSAITKASQVKFDISLGVTLETTKQLT